MTPDGHWAHPFPFDFHVYLQSYAHSQSASATTDPFCKYDDVELQLFTSSLFLAGAFAALVGMVTCRKWGRKITMTFGGICFLVGTALVAAAYAKAQLIIGRVVLGFGVGFATQATPLYLSEMAPFNLRGALNIM